MLEEVRDARAADPAQRALLRARLAPQTWPRELHKLGDVVIGVGAPLAGPRDGRPGPRLRRPAAAPRRGAAAARRRRRARWPTCCATCRRSRPRARSRPGRSTRAPTAASRSSRPTPTASSARSRAAACPPSATRSACRLRIEELAGRPRDRRRRRPLAPPHRGDRRDRLRALRAPLRGRPRQLARRPRRGRGRAAGRLDPGRVLAPGRDAAASSGCSACRAPRLGMEVANAAVRRYAAARAPARVLHRGGPERGRPDRAARSCCAPPAWRSRAS